MKWLFKWIKNGVDGIDQPELAPADYDSSINRIKSKRSGLSHVTTTAELQSRGTSFNLFNANGGYVVELRSYDNTRDEWKISLHVIPTGDEVGKSLEHIITLEALKR